MKDNDHILDTETASDAVNRKIGRPMPEQFKLSWGDDLSRPWLPAMLRWRRKDDDDDDPPPCPAVIAPFPRLPPFGAKAELEVA